MGGNNLYLVSYDIASDRLRNQIAKLLENYGRRVQYSVFECDLTEKRYKELYQKLLTIGNNMKDGNICFYYICKNCHKKRQIIGVRKDKDNYFEEEVIVI